jgi:GNAT superfamily N-acetyltransferase
MELEIRRDCSGIDWSAVSETLKCVGMAHHEPELHRQAFEASATVVFVYHDDQLVGFGRAISDGAYQAGVYDCAVLPEFQARGIGRRIMDAILADIPHCNAILYASPGKEGFYETFGFRKMQTGMARFCDSEQMKQRGFTE